MDKEIQLQRAKSLAITFLHIPMTSTAFSPVVVMHPFFESAFLHDKQGVFNAQAEEARYDKYLIHFRDNAINKCEDLSGLLSLIRKSYRLTYLLYMIKEKIITKKECGNFLAEHWTIIENLSTDTNVKKAAALSWIRAADKDKLMDKGELKKYNAFPEILTVYRGCGTMKALRGMSWTLSEEKARWFADRFATGQGGVTYRAKIRKEDIVAYMNNRGEQEVIVDYRKIFDVEQV